jgi:hypothetical protein
MRNDLMSSVRFRISGRLVRRGFFGMATPPVRHHPRRLICALVLTGSGVVRATLGEPARQVDQRAAPATHERPGRYELKLDTGHDGAVYIPAGYTRAAATPLLVWLHGAGGGGNVSPNLGAMADEFGVIVLAPDSREWTWDAILGDWGPDLEFLQRAMKQTLDRYSIDPGFPLHAFSHDGERFRSHWPIGRQIVGAVHVNRIDLAIVGELHQVDDARGFWADFVEVFLSDDHVPAPLEFVPIRY